MALEMLGEVRRGQRSSAVLDYFLEREHVSLQDRSFITELVYGVLRWQGKLDQTIERYSSKKAHQISPWVLDALRLGVYQLLFLKGITVYAAIYETVHLVKSGPEYYARGFVNGILRTIDRQRELIRRWYDRPKDSVEGLAFDESYPDALVHRWVDLFGFESAQKICRAENEMPPLTLRVNTLKINRQEFMRVLSEKRIPASPTLYSPVGIRLLKNIRVRELPYYEEGYFQIQDEASQLVGYAVSPQPGAAVLDVCAAPGGKTTHLAELTQDRSEILALDYNPSRVEKIKKNCERLGIQSVRVETQDFLKGFLSKKFDTILVDAPCSGWGILRRRPEAKWTRNLIDLSTFSHQQRSFLKKAQGCLKPGGVLVYSVCTFSKEETEEVISAFLEENPHFRVDSLQGCLPKACEPFLTSEGFLKIVPGDHAMDGFWMARLLSK